LHGHELFKIDKRKSASPKLNLKKTVTWITG